MNLWLLDLSPEARDTTIQYEIASLEDFLDASKLQAEMMAKIYAEWPQEKIRQTILEMLRAQYVYFAKRRIDLEKENSEARREGVSYAQRALYSAKIASLEGLIGHIRQLGTKWAKKAEFSPIYPSDARLIAKNGMEWYLKFIYIPIL